LRRFALDEPASQVQPPLPGLGVRGASWRANEQLPDYRLALGREGPEHSGLHGHDAPPQDRHPQADQDALDHVDGGVARRSRRRQEEHAQCDSLGGADTEQAMGDLGQHAGAVTGAIVRGSAPMGETRDGRERHREDVGGT
jgi:hypothetical protein